MATLTYADASKFQTELNRSRRPGDQVMNIPGKGFCIGESPLSPRETFDFSTETFVPIGLGYSVPPTGRKTGKFEVTLQGNIISSNSLKSVLIEFLKEVEDKHPGTWEKLSKIKARTRRIISRDKNNLFDSPHLAEDFAVPIGQGWYTNTNNSKQQVGRWLEEATAAAGLVWGVDVTAKLD